MIGEARARERCGKKLGRGVYCGLPIERPLFVFVFIVYLWERKNE